MYTPPSSYSGAQSPASIRKANRTPTCSSIQSTTTIQNKTPTCTRKSKRDHSPPPTVDCEADDNWEIFPWHELNTLPSKIQPTERKTISAIRNACTRKLARLDTATHKTANLDLIISGIHSIISQEWDILLVYFNEETKFAHLERPWSHKEWRRWDVVDFLTRIAVSYNEGCEMAASEGATLETKEVDTMFFALVRDLLALGAEAEGGVISLKEWERPGTMWVMELEEVSYSLTGYGYGECQD